MKMHFSCANIYSQCQCLHDSLQNMVAFFLFFLHFLQPGGEKHQMDHFF